MAQLRRHCNSSLYFAVERHSLHLYVERGATRDKIVKYEHNAIADSDHDGHRRQPEGQTILGG